MPLPEMTQPSLQSSNTLEGKALIIRRASGEAMTDGMSSATVVSVLEGDKLVVCEEEALRFKEGVRA